VYITQSIRESKLVLYPESIYSSSVLLQVLVIHENPVSDIHYEGRVELTLSTDINIRTEPKAIPTSMLLVPN
jgi:hypothetical protein